MQIQHVDVIEGLHETLAHSSKGRVIEIAVIGNEGEDAVASACNPPLGKADELHVVVVEPFGVALAKRLAVHLKVVASLLF